MASLFIEVEVDDHTNTSKQIEESEEMEMSLRQIMLFVGILCISCFIIAELHKLPECKHLKS